MFHRTAQGAGATRLYAVPVGGGSARIMPTPVGGSDPSWSPINN
jgi:TolB protein